MKIAILQDDFPPRHLGGAGTVAYLSAKELQKRGHQVLIITTERSSAYAGESTYDGLRVHTIVSDYDFRFQAYLSLWNPSVVRKVAKILAEFRPHVVHAHRVHGYLSYGSLIVAKRLGARVLLSCHDVMPFNYNKLVETVDPDDKTIPKQFNYEVSAWRQMRDSKLRYNPLRNVTIRYILRKYVDKVLAVSSALKDALEQNGIGNVEVVYNGLDASMAVERTRVDAFKDKFELGNAAVFFTGKPIAVKGGLVLLDAIQKIKETVPDVQVLVVGKEDAQTKRLMNRARELKVEDRVVITGWLTGDELKAAYTACAIAAVPSLCFDSFPTVNLEAMAAEKPVIATCFGGSSEAVVDGVTGYIINPYDIDLFGQRMRELLIDRDAAMHLGKAGYQRVKSKFTLERQAEQFERFYTA